MFRRARGRAVSREAGAPYADAAVRAAGLSARLAECVADAAATSRAGLRLTGHFLLERVLRAAWPRNAAGAAAAGRAGGRANQNSIRASMTRGSSWAHRRSNDDIRPSRWRKALAERYLAYALSTITQRALPDARDGLKPVHRRLLHAMRLLGPQSRRRLQEMRPRGGRRDRQISSPWRSVAIYEALVRLAQDFARALSAGRRPGQFRQCRRR